MPVTYPILGFPGAGAFLGTSFGGLLTSLHASSLTLPPRHSTKPVKTIDVTITDNDVQPVEVSFEQATYTAAEGSTVTVTLKLSAVPGRSVTIPITNTKLDGASNADYARVPTEVVFGIDDTVRMFTFTAASDTDNDDGESVKLAFGNLTLGVSAGTYPESVVSITDEDVQPVEVSLRADTCTVAEDGTVTVKVELDVAPGPERHHPDNEYETGRSVELRLLRGARQRDLRHRRHGEYVHVHCHTRHGERRRGVGEAGVGTPLPDRVSAGTHFRGRGLDHRRRCAAGGGELRAVHLYRR